ncbi:MAG: type VII secretion AAA-ATPase EccA [Gordonia sp. (in: high G+C Gram-positive bacteria)]|uniref:type VII secretion AAA-ATPase EccA n=1 Tax=Gordonia sp. (in: high G+C Gram-positive bacteria) TaxID=84139 RepID=UPI0039E37203
MSGDICIDGAVTTARTLFAAGLEALGFSFDGQHAAVDRAYALRALRRATELAPDMGDAWLGRVAAGDDDRATLLALHRAGGSIGDEQRRIGLPPRSLHARFPTGLYLDYPLTDATEAALAFACAAIGDGDYDGADAALTTAAGGPATAFVRALLHFRTSRWPDVLIHVESALRSDDDHLRAVAALMAGTSCAQLGLFDEAMRRFDDAEDGPVPGAALAARFTRGMCLRELGRPEEAKALFEQVYAASPEFTDAAAALRNPGYRLVVTTAEQIAARSDRWDPESVPVDDGPSADDALVAEAAAELDRQIGLAGVKEQVARLRASAALAAVRAAKGLASESRTQHLVFTGPPGTGKTTIARIVAKLFHGLGILATDTVVEASRRDFVGEHLGATAIKTDALIDRALDGVLFIDEAYTLIESGLHGGDVFGREAVDTLLARIENDRDRLVVIIAGYDGEIDRFLAANEGLASRFTRRIAFESYSPDELARIGEAIAAGRDSVLAPGAVDLLRQRCAPLCEGLVAGRSGRPQREIDLAGNGRFIRNVVEAAEEEREFRLSTVADPADLDRDALMRIEAADVDAALGKVLALRSP